MKTRNVAGGRDGARGVPRANMSRVAAPVIVATATAVCVFAAWRHRRRGLPPDDDYWMSRCHARRERRLLKPSQSAFRVTAIVVFQENGGGLKHVVGHNDEACNLLNSVCAERAAFLQLADRAQDAKSLQVLAVYISTDAVGPITPGALCREYMLSSPWTTPTTRIIMEGSRRQISRMERQLGVLYPFASVYTRRSRDGQMKEGLRRADRNGSSKLSPPPPSPPLSDVGEHARAALRGAVSASAADARAELHPVQYGACVVFDDGTNASASQKKALEYGCSLDAVCQLCQAIEDKRHHEGRRPVVLCMADQFGVAHAPFAPARAFLVEHGFGDAKILFHDEHAALRTVRAEELLPAIPDMFT